MSDLSKYLADLSPEKRALFEMMLKEKKHQDSANTFIPRRQTKDTNLPLSFGQQRLWFLDQWEQGNAAYNLIQALRLQGQLDVPLLEQCLNQIIERHEVLRTTFVSQNGQVRQHIDPSRPLALTVLDLQAETDQPAAIQNKAVQAAREPFDLACGPLMRACLLKLAADDHVLLLTMHHIVSDGWSNGVLLQEIGTLYLASGQVEKLPELPIQYADFALWQRQWMQGNTLEKQLNYWQEQLADAPPILDLPLDYPRPSVMTFNGARHYFSITPERTKELKALGQQEGASLFMTLLAAFNVLLYRYTHQKDILVGSPIANRNRAEIEGLIGFFVNTLVLRSHMSGNLTFRQLLQQVRQTTLAAYDHQDLPFEKLVEDMQLARDMSHSPLFQVVFVLQSTPLPVITSPDVTLTPLEIDSQIAQFDLTLELYESEGGIRGSFQYNTDLFAPATIARLETHWQTLLAAITTDPQKAIDHYPLLTKDEYNTVVRTWNATEKPYEGDLCLHQLFEGQVQRTPQAVALLEDGPVGSRREITYEALEQWANQVAHLLREQGVKPGTKVAVYFNRSLEMVVALFGILKAGGTYVPLEPTYPAKRVEWILDSLNIEYILTQNRHVEMLRELTTPIQHCLCLDSAEGESERGGAFTCWTKQHVEKMPVDALPTVSDANDIAYIIFTSGSTGTPKGVVVRHQPVINLIQWVNNTFQVGPTDRLLFVTSLCFDLSVYDIFGILGVGGSLHVVSDDNIREPEQLVRLLREEPITYWDSAPAALQQLVPFFPDALPESHLRLVFLSGDWIPVKLPDRVRQTFPKAQVISLGGATEATIWSNFYPIEKIDPRWTSIPYGRPIQNANYYVLDSRLNPCPIGVPGDLYIGGECLASGYVNAPTLTATKFIPDPFSQRAGAFLYRTGDRARWWADGNLEFLGRLDHQIKIRGFRVELGEIDTVLGQHPAVREATVLAHASDRLGRDRFLVAYVALEGNAAADPTELRRHLQKHLPDYMLPSQFIFLDHLPVTANGKLDRQALPAPQATHLNQDSTYVTPRNSVEDTIAGIWTSVLELDRVGVHNNFFELGGHSLLATQVIARMKDVFQVDLPLRTLFDGPTVAQLAASATEARAQKQGLHIPPITPVAETGKEYPLSLAQERLWLVDQLVPGNIAYISTGAARIRGSLDKALLERCFNEVIRRHAILRTNFYEVQGKPVQRSHEPEKYEMLYLDLQHLPIAEREAEAHRFIIAQARQPFDLARDRLTRIILVQLDKEDHLLGLATHHIIYDLMSIGIYQREMMALYAAYANNEPSPLPELAVQYADFSDWQQRWLRQSILDTQLPYWQKQLAGAQTVLELPTDFPRPPIPTFQGARYSFSLSSELTEGIKALSHESGVTLFMFLLAAYNIVLHRYTGQTDLIVGSPIANRQRTEIEEVIGFFVNIIILRTDMSGNPTFRELLARVREVALGAYMHQDVPFAVLVEELQTGRDLSRNPLFQVAFNFLHNYMMPVPSRLGLELELLRVHAETEQFDLSLDFWERPEGLQGSIDYNTDLFAAATIERFVENLLVVLQTVVTNPDQKVATLPLLTEEQETKLLHLWNDTDQPLPEPQLTIPTLFEAQAQQTPEALALIFGPQRLTYAELNARVNQLTHHLQTRGITTGKPVAVCMERSLEAIVALLAIFKAGGVYVPLDPTYPAERLAYIMHDARVQLLLTQADLYDNLPHQNIPTVCVDEVEEMMAQTVADELLRPLTPSQPAYVIYTSGSTGLPKGVVISHAAIAQHCRHIQTCYQLTPQDRVLQFASLNFDASLEQILPPLISGAGVVLMDGSVWAPADFHQKVQEFALTVVDLPPAYWHLVLQEWHTALELLPTHLRMVIIGGDVVPVEGWHLWRELGLKEVRLINAYGPTEATITTTIYDANTTLEETNTLFRVPIGHPLPDRKIYILDDYNNPTPIGVAGELHIGGAGLAQGYLNHPRLTAEHFVPDPFSTQPGARLYRTGDLARYLPDGTVDFLGRRDHQVKIRGFRIELGEIETLLNQHPAVQETVVVAQEDRLGQKYLVAYIVPHTSPMPSTSEFHTYLGEKLPAYMIPAAFMELNEIPLTRNGKLDRDVLPLPDQTRPELAGNFVAPRNAVEEVLAGICAELLLIERVGVYDNFFELGGHSLLATQLISQLRETFYIELSLINLFREPTVAGIARALQAKADDPANVEKTAQLILQLAQLSDEDVETMLEEHA